MPVPAIAQVVGVSSRTVRRWKRDWEASGGTPGHVSAQASAPATGTPRAHREAAPGPGIDEDPVGYWTAQLQDARATVVDCLSQTPPHTGAAATWGRIADDRAARLAKAIDANEERRAREERARVTDPGPLVARMLARLPEIVGCLAPDHRDDVVRIRAALDSWLKRIDEGHR